MAEPVRRAVIAARLPSHEWPAHPLVVTAIDAHSGAFTRFDASSGVPLVDAVAASCAVPGVWPPVSIGGRRYIDGGVRSVTNADLASGCGRVLVLAPMPADVAPGSSARRRASAARGRRCWWSRGTTPRWRASATIRWIRLVVRRRWRRDDVRVPRQSTPSGRSGD